MKGRFIVFLLTLGLICGLALWLLRLDVPASEASDKDAPGTH